MASDDYHEDEKLLSDETKNLHRGIVSLIEELEAIDWYQQRAEAATDPQLREVIIHNKNEEIEHAMMALEWIRRHSPEFDERMRTYLFNEGSITEAEAQSKVPSGETPASASGSILRIGSLKQHEE